MSKELTIVLKFIGEMPERPIVVFPAQDGLPTSALELDLFRATLVEVGQDGPSVIDPVSGGRTRIGRHEFTSADDWRLRLGGTTREASGTILGADSWASPELRIDDRGGAAPLRQALATRPGAELVIGRSTESDLVVDDGAVSRRHCRFVFRDGHHWVEDLVSRHGTRVNGESIHEARRLASGDSIQIGQVKIEYLSYLDKLTGVAVIPAPRPVRPPRPPRLAPLLEGLRRGVARSWQRFRTVPARLAATLRSLPRISLE
ncbi:MAG: FHA domain-containing protein, partial [Planctomycetes bacterium]|nr:FHA domain-containing protein [Planctomycetota bacterium]